MFDPLRLRFLRTAHQHLILQVTPGGHPIFPTNELKGILMTNPSIQLTTTVLPCCKKHQKVCVVCHFEWTKYRNAPAEDDLRAGITKWLGTASEAVSVLDSRFVGSHLVIFFKAPAEFDTGILVEAIECAVEDALVEHAVMRELQQ
ncbi:MAG: hypothetical protein IV086_10410 [Hyphomonadaceae bacterium]|nr:hypothetical protein [Hyphomonadaceae bacterium]